MGMWTPSFVPCNGGVHIGKRADNIFSVVEEDYMGIQAVENGFEDLDCRQTHLGFAEANLYQVPPEYAWVPRMLGSAE